MRLDALLQTLAVRAFSDCFGTGLEASQFSVQKTRSEFPGDRTIVCFPWPDSARWLRTPQPTRSVRRSSGWTAP